MAKDAVLKMSVGGRLGGSLMALTLLIPATVQYFDLGSGLLRTAVVRLTVWALSLVLTVVGLQFVWWLGRSRGVYLRIGPTEAVISGPTSKYASPRLQLLTYTSRDRLSGAYWHEFRSISQTKTQEVVCVRLSSGGSSAEIRVPPSMLSTGFEDDLAAAGIQPSEQSRSE